MFRLFRGLSIPHENADEVVEAIRRDGLSSGRGMGRTVNHARALESPRILLRASDLTREKTRPEANERPGVYAAGDAQGALFYATNRGKPSPSRAAIVVEFEASLSDIFVDGKDFLFPIFSRGDPERCADMIQQIFGIAVLAYAERAWLEKGLVAISLCDLALQDPEVVEAHFQNKLVISGKAGTFFRSAFSVEAPIPETRIVDIRLHEGPYVAPNPDVQLQRLIV